jgi:hypothetical protein
MQSPINKFRRLEIFVALDGIGDLNRLRSYLLLTVPRIFSGRALKRSSFVSFLCAVPLSGMRLRQSLCGFTIFVKTNQERGGELSFELEYESVSRDPKIHRSRFLLRVSISCSSACGRCRASRCQLPYGGDTEEVLAIQDENVLGQLVPAVRPSLPIRVFTSCPCCRYQESDKTTVGGN